MIKKDNSLISAILTIMVAVGSVTTYAQDTTHTFIPIVNYTADLVVNTHGGIKTGARYLGYGELGLEINPWRNGQFNFTIATTHGGEPTAELVGDWQVFDNIEAGNHIFALNAWYSHSIGKVTFKGGLQDANDSYSACDASGNLLNTSFGGSQVLLSGGNIPTMPNNGLGINVQWTPSDKFSWQIGAFDGGVIPLDAGNKFNLKHKLSLSKGYVIITEGILTPANALTLKVGAFYHTRLENNGYYVSCEKSFKLQGERGISAFVTGGYAPKATDVANASITCGATLKSVFSHSRADALAAGLSTVHLDGLKWETAVELNYRYQLGGHFYVSPDVQWIINPGADDSRGNALVTALRVGLSL